MSTVTPELLRELEELVKHSNEEEWQADRFADGNYTHFITRGAGDGRVIADVYGVKEDLLLICKAHNAMPALLNEIKRLRGLWCCLGLDVAQAVQHRNTKGGQQVHPPSFAMMPLSIQVQIERYLRWALGDNWEEEVQEQ